MVFTIPVLFLAGIYFGKWWTFSVLIFAFGIIPLLEIFFKPDPSNVDEAEAQIRKKDPLYDVMLYLIVPAVYICLFLFLISVSSETYSALEVVGLTLSMGVILGAMAINVAHELGHRKKPFERFLSKTLLLSSLYMHFYIEHNRGHHANVGTPYDPATAKKGQSVYGFWWQSVIFSYISAWKIESKRLKRAGKSFWSIDNEMLRFQVIQILLLISIFAFFGALATLLFVAAAIIGFLQLETVNYIEHYGLARERVNEKRFERVKPHHSWNSDHIIGRLMLFELSRHSDHHYKASKKYQLLESLENSPQMPTGYPGMMLLSLFPPLWFKTMDRRIPLS